VVAGRRFHGRRFEPVFASNREIDRILQHYDPTTPDREELWITDISWREPATDVHLERLVANGLRLYWIDHHKTAIDRRAEGHLQGPFTDFVLNDTYAASRLLYNYLTSTHDDGWPEQADSLADLERLVMMADDVDRWILKIPGSRELGLAVRAMEQSDAYRTLLGARGDVMHAPEIREALLRVETELNSSMALARATRRVSTVSGSGIEIVAAECDDYAGEIADRWKPEFSRAVFVLYDRRSDAISLRRTPQCDVDLSRLAAAFGGGGHAAAAGCQIRTSGSDRPAEVARKVAEALAREQSS
jgi:oligoribonuclease NrnB/cAMP/cGMP phosphodiesterase (DHH superfamily)